MLKKQRKPVLNFRDLKEPVMLTHQHTPESINSWRRKDYGTKSVIAILEDKDIHPTTIIEEKEGKGED